MLGSVLHLSMFCKALVFKWGVSSKKGSATKAKIFFVLFCVFVQRKKNVFILKRSRLVAAIFEEHSKKTEAQR